MCVGCNVLSLFIFVTHGKLYRVANNVISTQLSSRMPYWRQRLSNRMSHTFSVMCRRVDRMSKPKYIAISFLRFWHWNQNSGPNNRYRICLDESSFVVRFRRTKMESLRWQCDARTSKLSKTEPIQLSYECRNTCVCALHTVHMQQWRTTGDDLLSSRIALPIISSLACSHNRI